MGSHVKIDKALVQRVAELANLQLSADEIAHYETQLGKILGHVAQLEQLHDTLGKDWRADTIGESTPEREDLVKESLQVSEIMAQAPASSGTVFQVPRIIE
jgi:aspartyl-tRNA(Asn)/glutamyl-tRNA(Gln) amidotransferase subunit C